MVNFQYFKSHYPVTSLRLDLFSGAHLNKLLRLRLTVTEKSLIYGIPLSYMLFLTENEKSHLVKSCASLKIIQWNQVPKRRLFQLIPVVLCCLFWTS